MKNQHKLARFAEIDGFAGAALFTPDGRLLAKCEPVDINLELVGALANNVLRTAEKAALDMGLGHSHFTFIQTEKTLILLRCLNEGKNPLGPEPGKCHIHLVLLVDKPDSLGIAKLEINSVIKSLAEDFRAPEIKSKKKDNKEMKINKIDEAQEERPTVQQAGDKQRELKDVVDFLDNEHIDKAFDNLLI